MKPMNELLQFLSMALFFLCPVVTSFNAKSPAFVSTIPSFSTYDVDKLFGLDENTKCRRRSYKSSQMQLLMQINDIESNNEFTNENDGESTDEMMMSISSQMKFIGPYACLPLRFPKLATNSQKERNVTGISLDFVLDTAANINTLNAQVATELGLEVVGQAPLPAVGAAGGLDGGGDTFLLGDCQLEGYIPMDAEAAEEENPIFMTELTASALPIASPAAAGLLGIHFLNAFQGGVEFDWGKAMPEQKLPMVTFHGDRMRKEQLLEEGFTDPIPVTGLEGSYLPCITISINGVSIPALLDTGSPITVINPAAAKLANVATFQLEEEKKQQSFLPFKNPLNQLSKNVKLSQAMAQGDIVSLAGTDGKRIDLLRSEEQQSIHLENNSIMSSKIYVGNIPGLEELDRLVIEKTKATTPRPAAIFGMDLIRSKRRMLYRSNEVYFSEESSF